MSAIRDPLFRDVVRCVHGDLVLEGLHLLVGPADHDGRLKTIRQNAMGI
jgi:hypothetical protein